MKECLRKRSLLLCIGLAVLVAHQSTPAQSNPVRLETAGAAKPANLDFEEGEPGKVPAGWFATTASAGYPAEISADQPQRGKQCAVLRGANPTGQFGILMQAVDATPYRAHRIRLRAALRTEGARAQLWLRVDRTGRRAGFFDNMMDRPVTSASWSVVEITGDVHDDAETLSFGLLMIGTGRAYIDAVDVEDLGKLVIIAEPARPLSDRGLANIEAFARLFGYVRHFHPSDEAAGADWNAIAIEGVRQIEAAASPEELARRLEVIFGPVAPTVRIFPSARTPAGPKELEPPPGAADISVVEWKHRGFGGSTRQGPYASERLRAALSNSKLPDGFHDPRKPFVAELPGGVTCAVPLALFADTKGTLPHVAPRPAAQVNQLVRYSGNDRATRLADVVIAWNVFQHFYPYFDVTKTDWRAELGRALQTAGTDANEEAFTVTLRRMVAVLRDGHGAVQGPSPSQAAAVPVQWGWVENQLVVTAVSPAGAEGLTPGTVIEKVDGRTSRDVLEERERLISAATPQWARYRALQELRTGPDKSAVVLEVRVASGERRSVTLSRTPAAAQFTETRPDKIAEVRPGIFYLGMGRVSDADFDAALPKLEQARGIIFDMRGYPSGLSPKPLQHLTDKPIESARWNVPMISDPDWTGSPAWNTDGRWALNPLTPRLNAKVAFITDGRAISYAESWMGIVEAYKLAEIVGEPTAGTNGDVNPFRLPGDYTVYWTGMKVLKHDGSRHHGVGILPTVPVSRTIRGVAEGRDEQLERAIAVVGGGK